MEQRLIELMSEVCPDHPVIGAKTWTPEVRWCIRQIYREFRITPRYLAKLLKVSESRIYQSINYDFVRDYGTPSIGEDHQGH
jgi:hypothetical protein